MTLQSVTSEDVFKLYVVAAYLQSLPEAERESHQTNSVEEALELLAEAESFARRVIGIEACDGYLA